MEQKIEDIKKYTDEKFENQRSSFSAIPKDICATVFESFEKIIKEQMEKQNERISKLEADKCLLQEQVMSLKHANLQMENSKEELEQYGRRLCLRINGVPVKSYETSDDVLKYIKEIFDEGELDIPDTVIDRAHRLVQNILIMKQRKSVRLL